MSVSLRNSFTVSCLGCADALMPITAIIKADRILFIRLKCKVYKCDGGHSLHNYRCAKGEANIVTPWNAGLGDAGGRLESHAEYHGVAVGDAAVDAAGMVGDRGLGVLVTAAAVVARFFAALRMTVTMVFVFMTTLVIRIIVMALVLREQVYVL